MGHMGHLALSISNNILAQFGAAQNLQGDPKIGTVVVRLNFIEY